MSLPQPTLKRLPIIQQGLLKGLTRDQIGAKCGRTEKTIDRDIKAWVESGQFETWIKEEWIRLHHIIIHENPTEAYRQLTRLLGQTLTRRIESKAEITERIELVEIDVSETEDEILSKAASILERKVKSKSIH